LFKAFSTNTVGVAKWIGQSLLFAWFVGFREPRK
jgi:hypothetical protein